MDTIIMLLLALQLAIFLVTAGAILFSRPRADRPQPVWSSLALSLFVVGGVSTQIADRHAGEQGTELLMLGAHVLIGMALMAVFLLIRRRRGLGAIV